jgi:hypothetical protein
VLPGRGRTAGLGHIEGDYACTGAKDILAPTSRREQSHTDCGTQFMRREFRLAKPLRIFTRRGTKLRHPADNADALQPMQCRSASGSAFISATLLLHDRSLLQFLAPGGAGVRTRVISDI